MPLSLGEGKWQWPVKYVNFSSFPPLNHNVAAALHEFARMLLGVMTVQSTAGITHGISLVVLQRSSKPLEASNLLHKSYAHLSTIRSTGAHYRLHAFTLLETGTG